MMILFARIVLGMALVGFGWKLWRDGGLGFDRSSQVGLIYSGALILLLVLNFLVWKKDSSHPTPMPERSDLNEPSHILPARTHNRLVGRLHAWERLGWKRRVLWLSVIEILRHSDLPMGYLFAMRCARQGSWLERCLARRLFRFPHLQIVLEARAVLNRHGVDPGPHPDREVNRVLLSLNRTPSTTPAPVAVPQKTPSAPPKRNPQIKLCATPPSPPPSDEQVS
ncbi:MAG: hypothetical protein AB1813_21990 [Verrucomicrobiota bacterium]